MNEKPFGSIDPNSQHQVWSRWTIAFTCPIHIDFKTLQYNTQRFFNRLFGSVGRVKIDQLGQSVVILAEVEGMPVKDIDFVSKTTEQIKAHFILRGFGAGALNSCRISTKLLAGDGQDGKPAAQMIALPNMASAVTLFGLI